VSVNAFAHAMRQRLPAREKLVLILLGDRADDWGSSLYLALDTLAEKAGMSRSTLQRTIRSLIDREQLVLEVPATPTTTAFYRMTEVPEPLDAKASDEGCPAVLRKAVLHFFEPRCAWCLLPGTKDTGGDGRAWAVTRIDPTLYGGRFTPNNVTRACAFCARKKIRTSSTTVRALTDVVAVMGYQVDTPRNPTEGSQPDTSRVSSCNPPGVRLTPDPSLDPSTDPVQKEQGLPPRPPASVRTAAENVKVITVIAHEAIEQLGPTHEDLTETVKSLCATRSIRYNSAIVQSAIDSARWQRTHPTGAPS
jgi:hypothetical protein